MRLVLGERSFPIRHVVGELVDVSADRVVSLAGGRISEAWTGVVIAGDYKTQLGVHVESGVVEYVQSRAPAAHADLDFGVAVAPVDTVQLASWYSIDSLATSIAFDLRYVPKIPAFTSRFVVESMSIDDRRIDDLAPLAALRYLRTLRLPGTRVSDLSPLADLPPLGELDLTDCRRVRDLAALARHPDCLVHLDGSGAVDTEPEGTNGEPRSCDSLEEQRFVDAIFATPTDDTWLVYADWLMDRGDERGELVVLDRKDLRRPLHDRVAIARLHALAGRHGFPTVERAVEPVAFTGGGTFPVQYYATVGEIRYYVRYRGRSFTVEANGEMTDLSDVLYVERESEWTEDETRVILAILGDIVARGEPLGRCRFPVVGEYKLHEAIAPRDLARWWDLWDRMQ